MAVSKGPEPNPLRRDITSKTNTAPPSDPTGRGIFVGAHPANGAPCTRPVLPLSGTVDVGLSRSRGPGGMHCEQVAPARYDARLLRTGELGKCRSSSR